ncbi:MAG: hypothetical protein WCJ19_05225 [bacterium]
MTVLNHLAEYFISQKAITDEATSHITEKCIQNDERILINEAINSPKVLITGQLVYGNDVIPKRNFVVIVGGDTYSVPTEQSSNSNLVYVPNHVERPRLHADISPILLKIAKDSVVKLLPIDRVPGFVLVVNDEGQISLAGHATLGLPDILTSSDYPNYPCEFNRFLIFRSDYSGSSPFKIDQFNAIQLLEPFNFGDKKLLEEQESFAAKCLIGTINKTGLILPSINALKITSMHNGKVVTGQVRISSINTHYGRNNDGFILKRAVKHLKESA